MSLLCISSYLYHQRTTFKNISLITKQIFTKYFSDGIKYAFHLLTSSYIYSIFTHWAFNIFFMIPQLSVLPPRHLISVFVTTAYFLWHKIVHIFFFLLEGGVLTGGADWLWGTYLQSWVQSSYFHNGPWSFLAFNFFFKCSTKSLGK